MLVESGFCASTMGTLILPCHSPLAELAPGLAIQAHTSVADIAVISAGAGLHEELIFRVLGMGGIGFLLSASPAGGARGWAPWCCPR